MQSTHSFAGDCSGAFRSGGSQPRRPRVKIACDGCKRTKRKCDGSVPACELCRRKVQECVYSTKEEQPRRHKIRALELELVRLRRCVEQSEETVADLVNAVDTQPCLEYTTGDTEVNAQRLPHPPDTSSPMSPRCKRPDPSQAAVMEFGSSEWASSDTRPVPVGGPTGVYSMSKHRQLAPVRDSVPHAWLAGRENDPLIFLQGRVALKEKVLSAFHNRANRYGCFVDPTMYPKDELSLDLLFCLRFLHCTIFAAGAYLVHNPDLVENRSKFADYAKNMASKTILDSPGTEVLQGLIILTWLEMVNGDGLQILVCHSLAGSLVTHLGLDVIIPTRTSSTELGAAQTKTQVRIFWTYVFNDRIISAALGKLPGIQWRHVRTPEYRNMRIEGTWTLADSYFDTTCRLWRLFDIAMDEVYAPSFKELSQVARSHLTCSLECRLQDLYSGTDDCMKIQYSASKQLPEAYYLHIGFHTAIILLNRPLLERGTPGNPQRTLQTMVRSANAICQAIQRYCRGYCFAEGPSYLVLHITRACVVFLLIATSSDHSIQRSAANGLKHCLTAIDQCVQTWSYLGKRSIRFIQELALRWMVVKMLPMRYSNVIRDFDGVSSSQTDDIRNPDGRRAHPENVDYSLDVYNGFTWSDIDTIKFD